MVRTSVLQNWTYYEKNDKKYNIGIMVRKLLDMQNYIAYKEWVKDLELYDSHVYISFEIMIDI